MVEETEEIPFDGFAIREEVLANIARLAAARTDGVAGFVGAAAARAPRSKAPTTRGVSVGADDDGLVVDVHVSLAYGVGTMPDVAKAVQVAVSDALEHMTGRHVGRVAVYVDDVVFGCGT